MPVKQKLVVIIGPTAVGKTKTSIQLAKKFNGEIISGDSMQVYRGMDIGTAKIKAEEMEAVPHYFIDIKDPLESYTVAEFQQQGRAKIAEIATRGLPMIVGGTGLYIQSVIYDYQFSQAVENMEFRNELLKKAAQEGNAVLHDQLALVDPVSARRIHPNNLRRIVRALEIYECTGKTMTEYLESQQKELLYDVILIGLTMEREVLYERINARVDAMMEEGLLSEVQSLYEQNIRNVQSIQAIGYKELYDYLDGKLTLTEAIEQMKQNSRRYAKRQFTWFRNKMNVNWFDMTPRNDENKKIKEIIDFVAGKLGVK
ncbi:tRNA (adenosine(37)-N6)-dimethylallyltransferase MiaA [Bacillus chungangensis]|uniref:tRNA dimethylallyltransferase n=1 Tax=Bacillus chungangensis TaxID=587633 RepID=A0ABT9WP24_9BACI|nr:tRNA (adenosine(37)-N6)-dimethylallyltransferase MiaA [Bacillus chungangensis]MDQ0175031.1 tRNA dimethylallyltransferase [Bacillus chungangensis]